MADDYILTLQRPELKRFRQIRFGWDVVLIVAAIVVFLLVVRGQSSDSSEQKKIAVLTIAEVLMSAGMLPVLLSLPLIAADWTSSATGQCSRYSCVCFCFRDTSILLAYSVYFALFGVGFYLLYVGDKKQLEGALAEVFMEVGIMYTVSNFFGIAPVEADDARAFLSRKQSQQVERSGSLHAPFATAVDYVLCSAAAEKPDADTIHKQMHYHYPNSVDRQFAIVQDEVEDSRTGEDIESGPFSDEADGTTFFSHLLSDSPPGWDCPWYIAALGYCNHEKIPDLIPGLLSFISGAAFPKDRYVVQAAVTSIGQLYFDTSELKIASRLLHMWMNHEISNVRDHCVVALKAIAPLETVCFLNQLIDPTTITSTEVAEQYFGSQRMHLCTLHLSSIGEVADQLQLGNSHDVSMMILFSACAQLAPSAQKLHQEELQLLLAVIGQSVLLNPYERHVTITLGLEVMRRGIAQYKEVPEWDASFTAMQVESQAYANWSCRTSVFKSVRTAALAVLQEAEYPYLVIYQLFNTADATKYYKAKGFSSEAIRTLMEQHLGQELYDQLVFVLDSMSSPLAEIQVMFEDFDSAQAQNRLAAAALSSPTKDPALMLYTFISQEKNRARVPNHFIQQRLNSVCRLERYVGLLCIAHNGRKSRKMKQKVLPRFAECELISDVRDLAKRILATSVAESPCSVSLRCLLPACLRPAKALLDSDQRDNFIKKQFKSLEKRVAGREHSDSSHSPAVPPPLAPHQAGENPPSLSNDTLSSAALKVSPSSSGNRQFLSQTHDGVLGRAGMRGDLLGKGRTHDGVLGRNISGSVGPPLTPSGPKAFLFIDMGKQFESAGSITTVRYFVGLNSSSQAGFKFQVYRKVGSNSNFRLISDSQEILSANEDAEQNHSFAKALQFEKGDYPGWAHTTEGPMSYEEGGSVVLYKCPASASVGETISFAPWNPLDGGARSGSWARTYSYEFQFEKDVQTSDLQDPEKGGAIANEELTVCLPGMQSPLL